MLKLLISDDEGKTTTVPLVRDEITIGRKEGNTIRLTERNVSRRHARISRRQNDFILEDLASYNGIVINGARLTEARPVRNGDQVLIGDYKLQIVEEAGAQPTPPPPAPPPPPSEHMAPLLAATPPPAGQPGQPPGLASLNNPFAPPGAGGAPVPESIRGMRVVFLAPAGVPAPVLLDRLPMVLGRSESADIALAFSSISREHARLFCENDKLFIEDLGSSNGIQVNGEKLRKSELSPGDMVQLGVVEFRVARRGDSTVVIQTAALHDKINQSRPPKLLIAGVVGGGIALGLAVLLVFNHSRNTGVTAPSLPAPSATAAPSEAPVTPVANTPPTTPIAAPSEAPSVAPSEPPAAPSVVAAPPPAPSEAPEPPPTTPEVAPSEAPVAPSVQVLAPAHTSRHGQTEPRDRQHTSAPAAPTPRANPTPPTPAPAPSPPSTAAVSGSSPLERALSCRQSTGSIPETNSCMIRELAGHASTEREWGLLATTYRSASQQGNAVRTMRTYIERFPTGPRVADFQRFIDNAH